MFGMLINSNAPWAPNVWKIWVDHIMKQKFGFKKASLLYENGGTASSTPRFFIPSRDVVRIRRIIDEGLDCESIMIDDKTYVIKTQDKRQLIAFNGSKYYIICRSGSMLIFAQCSSRAKLDEAAAFLRRLNAKLIAKDF